jgi:hypothetical protein
MLSAVNLGPMIIGSVACGSDPAVLLASLDDEAADAAEARVELAGAWLVGVVVVATVVVFVDCAFENVVRAFESGELGAAVLELDAKLSKSCSCG